jgi:hypothetical protein
MFNKLRKYSFFLHTIREYIQKYRKSIILIEKIIIVNVLNRWIVLYTYNKRISNITNNDVFIRNYLFFKSFNIIYSSFSEYINFSFFIQKNNYIYLT